MKWIERIFKETKLKVKLDLS